MVVLLAALVGYHIAPVDPFEIDIFRGLEKPSREHWFGTDELGRDIFSRVLIGTKYSMLISLVGVSVAVAMGVPLGLIAGYLGGATDSVIMGITNILLAFPSLLLALLMISILGPGLMNTMIAVGISSVPTFIRIARGSMMAVKEEEFVTAAESIGASKARIIFRHCLPNISGPLIVQATLRVSTMILTAAGLGFIGLGVQPPTPEWGTMMSESRAIFQEAPHTILFPGLAVMITVFGFNLFGDAVRDLLDPKNTT